MGWESPSSSGKRSRDPEEEEVCLDNFHSHKRYLSEIMATSLNGLTVGDSLTESLMESPLRDEVAAPYSPMSDDSDDSRFIYDAPLSGTTFVQSDAFSRPTSPVSPHWHQKPFSALFSSVNAYPLPGCTLPAVVCSHPRQRRSDSEGRFPSSPSDMCHTADLRRAALLRSVQMRSQPHCLSADDLPFHNGQENMQSVEDGDDHRPCADMRNRSRDRVLDYDEGLLETKLHQEEKCYEDGFASKRISR